MGAVIGSQHPVFKLWRSMKSDPKAVKVAWTVWGIFIISYIALNLFLLKSDTIETEKLVVGMGIAMPILCNLTWWVIGFRLRNRVAHWWALGFSTAVIVGIAGFLTMLAVSKSAQKQQSSNGPAATSRKDPLNRFYREYRNLHTASYT